MAVSDPATDVPTPTGTLQGVAAFSWDGSAWQPAGRASPFVATPTGVLRGIAPFSWDGASWQPVGRAQPGVATPSGVLDGVAVYTWSGSAWTPSSGTATPSTLSGSLRGIAAFNWDGSAWQPSAQAGPSVATPYGVLDGMAMFNWTGSAWAAVQGPSLNLSFMTPGSLDARITFARASTATYFNSSGTMQTAATNAPRWDYNPSTLALNGLLIEEARTNLMLYSTDLSNGWTANGGAAANPVLTVDNAVAPDGTMTASRIVYPTISVAGSWSYMYQSTTATAAPYTASIYLRGAVGGEAVNFAIFNGTAIYFSARATLTTAWQRFSVGSGNLTAAPWYMLIGTDLRDVTQTTTAAATIYAWGAQLELGTSPTSYIPTAAATATRAIDNCTMSTAGLLNAAASSILGEFIVPQSPNPSTTIVRDVCAITDGTASNRLILRAMPVSASTALLATSIASAATTSGTVGTVAAGTVSKLAGAWNGTTAYGSFGGAATVSYSVGMPGSLTTLGIGNDYAGAAGTLNGWVRHIQYWPRALSAGELQAVTT